MRQTFKPFKRRESKAFALRREALKNNVEDTLTNDENLENIDNFWDAATSRLKLEQKHGDNEFTLLDIKTDENDSKSVVHAIEDDKSLTIKSEMMEKLKCKKSFDVAYAKEVKNVDISGISETAIMVEENSLPLNSDANENYINDGDVYADNDNYKPNNIHEELNGLDKISNSSEIVEVKKQKKRKKKSSSNSKKSVRFDFDKMKVVETYNESPAYPVKKSETTKEECSVEPKRIKLSDSSISLDYSSNIRINDSLGYVKNINDLEKTKSQMMFLIDTDELETGVLFLRDNDYIKEMVADRSFSLVLLQGGVVIKADGKEITLKRHGICVIKKGSNFSITNIKGYKTKIFISYVIS